MRRSAGLAVGAALLLAACSAPPGMAPTASGASTSISPDDVGGSTAATSESTAAVGGTITYEIVEGVTVDVPSTWFPVEYRGIPATVYFPLQFFSTAQYTGACSSGKPREACLDHTWFPPDLVTPDDGVIVLWSESQFPFTGGPALVHLHGDVTSINGHRAKVWTGTATRGCSRLASTEMDAYVLMFDKGYPGQRIDLTACFGEHAPDDVRAAVRTMLDSLQIAR